MVPEHCISKLEKIKNIAYTVEDFNNEIRRIKSICDYDAFHINVFDAVENFTVTTKDKDAFETHAIFSDSKWLHNISLDFRTVLGELETNQNSTVFIDYLPVTNKGNSTDYQIEFWLEMVVMDKNYYEYQKSYIQQAFQMANPYASPVQVHSNIINGTGIFAGYSKQMIHFYDY